MKYLNLFKIERTFFQFITQPKILNKRNKFLPSNQIHISDYVLVTNLLQTITGYKGPKLMLRNLSTNKLKKYIMINKLNRFFLIHYNLSHLSLNT